MIDQETLRLLAEGGNNKTVNLDFAIGDRFGPTGLLLSGNYFNTDGYHTVLEEQRGTIDTKAKSEHATLDGRLEYSPSPGLTLHLGGAYYDEARDSGTPYRETATTMRTVRGGGKLETSGGSIHVEFPENEGVDLKAQTSGGRITIDKAFAVSGRVEQSEVEAELNGGGAELSLETSGGNIRVGVR